jgi:hypothetical protein
MKGKIVLDCRNVLNTGEVAAAGLDYHAIGRYQREQEAQ